MFQNFLTKQTLYVTIESRSSEQTENRRRQNGKWSPPQTKIEMHASAGEKERLL